MSRWIGWRSETPILAADRPWEASGLMSAISIVVVEQRLRLYYLAIVRDDPTRNVLCVAESSDGRTWTKPDLGEDHNIVMRSSGHETGWGVFMPTRIFEEPDEPNPDWRWKMILWERPTAETTAGICLAVSADGLKWNLLGDRPIIGGANDAMSMVSAHPKVTPPRESRWLLYQQTWAYNPDLPQERDNLKGVHRQISLWWNGGDFDGKWTGPIVVLSPDDDDPPDLQHYWLSPYQTRTGYGGLLFCHHTGDQTMDVQRVTSSDGWRWTRADDREPLLPLGERGRFDCGMVTSPAGPCRFEDRVLLPYNGRCTVHDQQQRYPEDEFVAPGIGMAELDPAILDE